MCNHAIIPFSDVENARRLHDHDTEFILRATDSNVIQREVPVVVIKPAKCLENKNKNHKLYLVTIITSSVVFST